VLADFVSHYNAFFNITMPVESWNFDRSIRKRLNELADNKEFWLSMPAKISPNDIPFEPHCYITSRTCPKEWVEEWLSKHNFPTVPVYVVHGSKIKTAKSSGIDWFVDDRFRNFVEFNNAGV